MGVNVSDFEASIDVNDCGDGLDVNDSSSSLSGPKPKWAIYSANCMSGSGLPNIAGTQFLDKVPAHFRTLWQSTAFAQVVQKLQRGVISASDVEDLDKLLEKMRRVVPGMLGDYHYKMLWDRAGNAKLFVRLTVGHRCFLCCEPACPPTLPVIMPSMNHLASRGTSDPPPIAPIRASKIQVDLRPKPFPGSLRRNSNQKPACRLDLSAPAPSGLRRGMSACATEARAPVSRLSKGRHSCRRPQGLRYGGHAQPQGPQLHA